MSVPLERGSLKIDRYHSEILYLGILLCFCFLWVNMSYRILKIRGAEVSTYLLTNQATAKILRKIKFNYVLTFIMN